MSGFALRAIVLVVWLPMMVVLALLYMTLSPSPDQSQFDWMAFIATQGQPYYAGSFDMNWPGAMWLHEAGIRLFGVHAWTWRLTDFLMLAGYTAAGAAFLARDGWRTAPIVFLFLYPPLYVTAGGWMAGQRDMYAAGFLLVACALAMPGRRWEFGAVFAAGVFVAAAVLVRPTFLTFIVGLILLEALPLKVPHPRSLSRIGRAMGFALGLAAGIGAAVVAGLILGILDDWYQQSIEFSLLVYFGEPPQDWRVTLDTLFVRSWHWICFLALIGFGFWAWRDRFGYALVLTLGLAATSAVSFAVQNKGFGYHLAGVLPVLVLFAAVAFDGLDQWRRTSGSRAGSRAAVAALALIGLLAFAGTAKKLMTFETGFRLLLSGTIGPAADHGLTEAERREIVDTIKAGSSPDETVVVYGTNFDLAYRAERLPSHRFTNIVIDQADASFPYYDAWMDEIDASLAKTPPAYMIFDRSFLAGPTETPSPAMQKRPVLNRLVNLIADGYVPVFSNETVVVYGKTG